MLLSRKWLSEYTKIDASPKDFEDVMTLSGSKVEVTRDPGAEVRNVVVGRVVSIEHHPDSGHMWVCQVDAGQPEPVQIVTGAQNVREGDLVPAALHKSVLPGGKKIEKGKLRGVLSDGMLCSLSELGLDAHDFPYMTEDGIMAFSPEDAAGYKPGDDIKPLIGADDSIVEFEITNNRPDCLSVLGLAREAAAAFGTELRLPEPSVRGGGGDIASRLTVEIANPELCPRYTAKMVKNIKIAPSPRWLRERLRAAGVRPINNIVDITNYVMLEYGQPMHAFDYACLAGGKITVRTAKPGETMKTLDGTERSLSPEMLVIADGGKPVGVAGVMGGENSEITEATRLAVFESATFDGVSVRKTAAALGMRTDASSRFEKGLDTENTVPAVLRACQLVELLGAGEVLDGAVDTRAGTYVPATLKLQPERINALLGTDIPRGFMAETLIKLGFAVAPDDTVTVPSWRADVSHYTDLAEEVARFYGYDKITPTLNPGSETAGGYSEKQRFENSLSAAALALGYSEIFTYSFIGTSDYDKILMPADAPEYRSVTILNPLGEDRAVMRTTPLPSMLGALANNRSARNDGVRLFELAKIYVPGADDRSLPDERIILTLGAFGGCDFFDIKGAVEELLRGARTPDVRFASGGALPSFHGGRFARIFSGGTEIGFIGQIHPNAAKNYDLPDAYCAELDAELLLSLRAPEPRYAPLPRFPSSERDVAVVCDASLEAAELFAEIRAAGGKLLKSLSLFDVYTGSQVPDGKKSLAVSLSFRDDSRTLTDAETDAAVANILAAVGAKFGAALR
ncbi:MAG: phenylalanine--tRNA ligase subunit beta [Oscillospiraceae bacterium]|jgi:phenylalanyl-tRNA synthetase beta chain|nr:phenylalanine--tRNA ligase subunit beta [Oscillospiraceae bacterium]